MFYPFCGLGVEKGRKNQTAGGNVVFHVPTLAVDCKKQDCEFSITSAERILFLNS